MRTMYDDITAGNVPAGGDLYLGYDDGAWPDAAALAARFPAARVLRATVNEADDEGDVGDCESGDMDPAGLVRWIVKRRAAGHPNPLGYFSLADKDTVLGLFAADRIARPMWIVADYIVPVGAPEPPAPTIPAEWIAEGCVGWQFYSCATYDRSTVVDHIPGVDPEGAADMPAATDFVRHLPTPDGYWHLRADGTIDRSPGSAWRPHAILANTGQVYTFPYAAGGVTYEDYATLPALERAGVRYFTDIWLT